MNDLCKLVWSTGHMTQGKVVDIDYHRCSTCGQIGKFYTVDWFDGKRSEVCTNELDQLNAKEYEIKSMGRGYCHNFDDRS